MKNENNNQPEVSKMSHSITRRNKKRLLPDIFYLRWELELLSAFILIAALMEAPSWVSSTENTLFLNTGINPLWITVFTTTLIIGFSVYTILRLVWLILVSKRQDVSTGQLHFIREIDQVAELIISVCIIVLVIGAFAYFIRLLAILLQNEMIDKTGNPFKMDQ